MRERRQHVRTRLSRPVTVYMSDATSVTAEIADLSQNGIAIVYSAPASLGTLLTLEFRLTVREEDDTLKLQGIVRNIRLAQDKYRIGLEFVEPPEDHLETINTFIQDRIRAGIVRG